MKNQWHKFGWIGATFVGSAIFALGFSMFLEPNNMSAGGISGLALVFVELTGIGTVGTISILINLPLFVLGGLKIGRRFFVGSLMGMTALLPWPSLAWIRCWQCSMAVWSAVWDWVWYSCPVLPPAVRISWCGC